MITVIVGPRASGKTTVALALMIARHGLRTGNVVLFDEYENGMAYVAAGIEGLTTAWRHGKQQIQFTDAPRYVYITTRELTPELEARATFIIRTESKLLTVY